MPLQRTDWTAEMLNELPDDGSRYEVVDGELLVTPAPSLLHQLAQMRLAMLIAPYAAAIGLDTLAAPTAVTFSERREVQPDLLVIPRKPDGRHASRFSDVGLLLLAIEILSPSTARADRHEKRALYQDEGVPEYWIVNIEEREVERWTGDSKAAELCSETISWKPLAMHDALDIDLQKYFRELLDGEPL